MYCAQCGKSIQEQDHYCSHCGHEINHLEPAKRTNSRWIKLLFAFVIALFVIVGWTMKGSQDLVQTVEGQLAALRANKVSEAYYEFTSRDFQSNIPLPYFRELTEAYAILTQNTGISHVDSTIQDGLARLKGTLIAANMEGVPVEYDLIQEDDKWKIHNMLLALPLNIPSAPNQTNQTIEWLIPIESELRLLRTNKLWDAYRNTTSKDFQKATSFQEFMHFIKRYPILTSHKNIVVKSQSIKNDEADVTILLDPEKNATPVRYLLVHEDGAWKIWNMNVTPSFSEAALKLMKEPLTTHKPIDVQLDALKHKDIAKAYDDHTSAEFKKATSLEDFRKFIEQYPLFENYDAVAFMEPSIQEGSATVMVDLYNKQGSIAVEYTLGIENDQWNIWGIQVVKASAQGPFTPAENTVPTTPPPPPSPPAAPAPPAQPPATMPAIPPEED